MWWGEWKPFSRGKLERTAADGEGAGGRNPWGLDIVSKSMQANRKSSR